MSPEPTYMYGEAGKERRQKEQNRKLRRAKVQNWKTKPLCHQNPRTCMEKRVHLVMDDADACNDAADILGARYVGVASYGSIPSGCVAELEDGDVKVWMNEATPGKAKHNRRPICIMMSSSEEVTTESPIETTASGGEEEEGETTETETTAGAESEGETTESAEIEDETTEGAESEGETTE